MQGKRLHATLPPFTEDLMMTMWWFVTERERSGWKRCFKYGIGKMRRDFGMVPDDVRIVIDGFADIGVPRTAPDRRMSVRVLGIGMCEACPLRKCPYNPEHDE